MLHLFEQSRVQRASLPVALGLTTTYRQATKNEVCMSDERLNFKEMCARFDVTPRTLRYYEYIELLKPDRENRSRFYGSRECARMELILRGRKFGFQLEGIRQWLLIYENEGTEVQMLTFVENARRQIIELTSQRDQIDEALSELTSLREATIKSLE
jgi:DNA-binding transcriptional MerR regulator